MLWASDPFIDIERFSQERQSRLTGASSWLIVLSRSAAVSADWVALEAGGKFGSAGTPSAHARASAQTTARPNRQRSKSRTVIHFLLPREPDHFRVHHILASDLGRTERQTKLRGGVGSAVSCLRDGRRMRTATESGINLPLSLARRWHVIAQLRAARP